MATAIIPRTVSRALAALRHLLGTEHTYSDTKGDFDGAELAAFLRLNGQLYAIWIQSGSVPTVQLASMTDWSLCDDPTEQQVKIIEMRTNENDEVTFVCENFITFELALGGKYELA